MTYNTMNVANNFEQLSLKDPISLLKIMIRPLLNIVGGKGNCDFNLIAQNR